MTPAEAAVSLDGRIHVYILEPHLQAKKDCKRRDGLVRLIREKVGKTPVDEHVRSLPCLEEDLDGADYVIMYVQRSDDKSIEYRLMTPRDARDVLNNRHTLYKGVL